MNAKILTFQVLSTTFSIYKRQLNSKSQIDSKKFISNLKKKIKKHNLTTPKYKIQK